VVNEPGPVLWVELELEVERVESEVGRIFPVLEASVKGSEKVVGNPPDPSVETGVALSDTPLLPLGSTTALVATPLVTGMVVASAGKSKMLLVVESKLVWPRAMRLFLRS